MLNELVRRTEGLDLGVREAPSLPVHPALVPLLPGGLPRGGAISVAGSISLLFALLGTASAQGAWCALVDLPRVNVESAMEYGITSSRLVIIHPAGAEWTIAVGALLDAFDVVVVRPPSQPAPTDVRRLAARTRMHDAVLVPFLTAATSWPGSTARLSIADSRWHGPDLGHRRLRRRQVTVIAERRGPARSASLWLPAAGGGVAIRKPIAPVVELVAR